MTRRAATEVLNDSGLRFIRVQDFVVPEPTPGQPVDAGSALSNLGYSTTQASPAESGGLDFVLESRCPRKRIEGFWS